MAREATSTRAGKRRAVLGTADEAAIREALAGAAEFLPLDAMLAREPRNDLGNARRLIARFGRDLIWADRWHAWTGEAWSHDEGPSMAVKLAQRTGSAIVQEARALRDEGRLRDDAGKEIEPIDDFRDRVLRHAKFGVASGNTAKVNAMLDALQPHVRFPLSALDARPGLLNVANGTVELTGDVARREFRRDDLLTRAAPVSHTPDAECPRFRAFLERILPDDAVRVFLQRWFGYCLTGEIGEQVMVLFYGKGANGKSTLLNIVRDVLGPYVQGVPVAALLESHTGGGGDATPDLARLPGARLVLASEPEKGARLSAAAIKRLTSGEPIQARPLWGEFFDFTPQFKLVLSFNVRPPVPAQDDGMWRRLLMIGFDVKITDPVLDFHKTFADEHAGILNWMLDGYRFWRESGLGVPESVRELTRSYRGESDPVGQFLMTCVEPIEGAESMSDDELREGRVTRGGLWQRYEEYCKHNAIEPVKANAFGRALTAAGLRRCKSSTVAYLGIRLRERWDADPKNEPEPKDGRG